MKLNLDAQDNILNFKIFRSWHVSYLFGIVDCIETLWILYSTLFNDSIETLYWIRLIIWSLWMLPHTSSMRSITYNTHCEVYILSLKYQWITLFLEILIYRKCWSGEVAWEAAQSIRKIQVNLKEEKRYAC